MKNTKWQLKILELHSKSKIIDIDNVYYTCSRYKRQAFDRIWNEYSHPSKFTTHLAHYNFAIISFNKMMFTCGYIYAENDGLKIHFYFKYFSHRRTVVFEIHDSKYL